MGSGNEVASKVSSNPSAFSPKPTVETPVSTLNVSLENRKEHSMANKYNTLIYVTGFAKTQHNVARTEIHFIA